MPNYVFDLSVDATLHARVEIEADSEAEAWEIIREQDENYEIVWDSEEPSGSTSITLVVSDGA